MHLVKGEEELLDGIAELLQRAARLTGRAIDVGAMKMPDSMSACLCTAGTDCLSITNLARLSRAAAKQSRAERTRQRAKTTRGRMSFTHRCSKQPVGCMATRPRSTARARPPRTF
jgi:hypothetical protein